MSLPVLTQLSGATSSINLKCGTLTADTITVDTFTVDTFTSDTITADTVTADTIATDTVTADTIATDTITVGSGGTAISSIKQSQENTSILIGGFTVTQITGIVTKIQTIGSNSSCQFNGFIIPSVSQTANGVLYWESPSTWLPFGISGVGAYVDIVTAQERTAVYSKDPGAVSGQIRPTTTLEFVANGNGLTFRPVTLTMV